MEENSPSLIVMLNQWISSYIIASKVNMAVLQTTSIKLLHLTLLMKHARLTDSLTSWAYWADRMNNGESDNKFDLYHLLTLHCFNCSLTFFDWPTQ